MDFIILIVGFFLLIKGADWLVEGASSIATKYGISSLVIGLTIVAFGTSAPELVVNMFSAFGGETQLAISNIVGSNISNVLLILGTTSIVYPILIPHSTVKKEIPFLIFASTVLLLLLVDGELSRIDALLLLTFFAYFLYYTYTISKQKSFNEHGLKVKKISNKKSYLLIIGGLVGLLLGGKLIIYSAVSIAESFGLPQSFIGITIIAIGTSLPELAASLMAAFKKNTDMAIGGIVGSNIFNILWILGITGFIYPLKGYDGMLFDLGVGLGSCILIFFFAFAFGRNFLNRYEGVVLLTLYIIYISYLTYGIL